MVGALTSELWGFLATLERPTHPAPLSRPHLWQPHSGQLAEGGREEAEGNLWGAMTAVEQLRVRVLRPRAVCTCLPPHLTPTPQEAGRAGAWMETGARFSMYW